jgi:hypothetical protein
MKVRSNGRSHSLPPGGKKGWFLMDRPNPFAALRPQRPFPALEWLATRRTAPLPASSTPAPTPASAPPPPQAARPVPPRATRRGEQSAPRSLTLYDFEIRVLLSYAPEWLREVFLPRL